MRFDFWVLSALGLANLVLGCSAELGSPSGARSDGGAQAGGVGGALAASGGTSGAAGGSAGTGGVSGAAAASSGCEPTAESIHRTILLPNCTTVTCHGARAAATLDLTLPDWESRLVGASAATCDGLALVVPGSPEQSFLYQKVTEDMPACGGERMPVDEKLADADVQCISDWISNLSATGCETCGGSECVSLPSDPLNCGRCGNVCPEASSCQSGSCVCSTGQIACGTECVNVLIDAAHCGDCGVVCPAGASCNEGSCECAGGLTSCGDGCYELASDAAHCGTCATSCSEEQVCQNGVCSAGCGTLTQCGSSCVDLESSTTSCGSCDNACPAGLSCVGGSCNCEAGQTLCDSGCVDLTSDAAHCGSCGRVCGPGSTCTGGECQCGSSTVSFKNQIEPILVSACTSAGCHTGMRPKEDLSLDVGAAYAELVNVATSQCGGGRVLVKAGNAGQSYLMQKLLGIDLCSGSQMPKAGQSLSGAELSLINDWICQGATDN